jgi:hypothetical protein
MRQLAEELRLVRISFNGEPNGTVRRESNGLRREDPICSSGCSTHRAPTNRYYASNLVGAHR